MTTVPQQDAARAYVGPPTIAVSGGGRYVAFVSCASLVPADVNGRRDVYVHDRVTGSVTLESLSRDGRSADVDSGHPGISDDGRYLVYQLAAGTQSSPTAVMLRDRATGTVTPVGPASAWSSAPVISGDGRFAVFVSAGEPVVPGGDANGGAEDVYALSVATGAIERISVDAGGVQSALGASIAPATSGDGRYVVFASTAPLDPSVGRARMSVLEPPRISHIYLRDRTRGTTRLVTRGAAGRPADGPSSMPAIDRSGRHVAFVSSAANLTGDGRRRVADIFLVDLDTGAIELVSRSARGGPGNGPSARPALSAEGRYVAFQSEASDLVCARDCKDGAEDINLLWDVLIFDRRARLMTRVSGGPAGGWLEPSVGPALDAAGDIIAFSSRHPIDPADVKNDFDLFIRSIRR